MSARSAWWKRAAPPASWMARTTSSPRSRFRPWTRIRVPGSASSSATSRPSAVGGTGDEDDPLLGGIGLVAPSRGGAPSGRGEEARPPRGGPAGAQGPAPTPNATRGTETAGDAKSGTGAVGAACGSWRIPQGGGQGVGRAQCGSPGCAAPSARGWQSVVTPEEAGGSGGVRPPIAPIGWWATPPPNPPCACFPPCVVLWSEHPRPQEEPMALENPGGIRTPRSMRAPARPAPRRVIVHRLRPGRWLSAFVLLLAALLPSLAASRPGVGSSRCAPTWGWGVERTASEVRVMVDGRVARVEVTEWFPERGSGGIAEGHYLYPPPRRGLVLLLLPLPGGGRNSPARRWTPARPGGSTGDRGPAPGPRPHRDGGAGACSGPGCSPSSRGRPGRWCSATSSSWRERRGAPFQLRGGKSGAEPGRIRPADQPGHPPPAHPLGPFRAPASRPWREGALFQQEDAGGRHAPHRRRLPHRAPLPSYVVTDAGDFLEPFSPTHRVEVERVRGRLQVRSDEVLEGPFTLFPPLLPGAHRHVAQPPPPSSPVRTVG